MRVQTKYYSIFVFALFLFASSFPGAARAQGGFQGPGPSVISVERAKTLRDDAKVRLRGRIIENLGGDEYTFQDETGSVTVEIDHDLWAGQTITPSDVVELRGEVDKDWLSVAIDADSVRKL